MIAQVMLDALLRELPDGEKPKVVLFSDSRQDAAKLSVNIELNHYRHLLRYIIVKTIREQNKPIRAFISSINGKTNDTDELKLAKDFRKNNYRTARDIEDYYHHSDDLPIEEKTRIQKYIIAALEPPKLEFLWDELIRNLLKLGINPGGPENSLYSYKPLLIKKKSGQT
ncbi:hypothetical protein H1D32_24145 [Anaerobacillus sp. CMMVII]|uniref:hypothetical protein n=1 Tax=Anaerobacillus sp. CMMVII TaxID=2755588 RepID=UPI0021B75578|nr:hypothetical protein [Anaerobacillus sp. CMMVII]MCT8140492.1 hypothetical protein [Anaerobacillus sp. CMMVII]